MQTEIKPTWLRVYIWRQIVCVRVYFHSACARECLLDIGFALGVTSASHYFWHRLRIRLDIGFTLLWHRRRIPFDIGFAFPLTSASHSSWHRLRIIWKLYWNNINSSNKIMPIWPPKSFQKLSKITPKSVQIPSKSLPKSFPNQASFRNPWNKFPNPDREILEFRKF